LNKISAVPPEVLAEADLSLVERRDFLKIVLDFFVRGGGSLSFSRDWRKWLGVPFPLSYLIPANAEEAGKLQRRWPAAGRGGMRTMLVRLLANLLGINLDSVLSRDRIDAILSAAWQELGRLGLLRQEDAGRVLPVTELAFSVIEDAWICPVTRRFLDTTLRDVTPYLPEQPESARLVCEKVKIPLYTEAFSGVSDDIERIRKAREWAARHPEIKRFREEGLW